jgi:phage tail P2-like protein
MSDTTSLLPPNATPTERALSSCTARTTALAVGAEYRSLWSPLTCPIESLPWLAWALHVDEWDENWSEEQMRQVIADSVAVHKTKGTIGALKRALQSLGYEVTVDDQTGDVFTFRLGVNLNQTGPLTSESFLAMRRVALANKNARSRMLIRSAITNTAKLYIGVGQYRAQTVTVDAGEYTLPVVVTTLVSGLGVDMRDMCFASDGNLYATTYSSGSVLKITLAGVATTLASGLGTLYGICSASDGNLYVTERIGAALGSVLKITLAGDVTTLASGLGVPYGICSASDGNLYVTDNIGSVRKITLAGVATTLASGIGSGPYGICYASDGNLYVIKDTGYILRITLAGVATTLVSGFPPYMYRVCQVSDGILYVTQYFGIIYEMTLAGVMTPLSLELGTGTYGICRASDGNLYISKSDGSVLRISI